MSLVRRTQDRSEENQRFDKTSAENESRCKVTSAEMSKRLEELQNSPELPLRDLCQMLRASIKPSRSAAAADMSSMSIPTFSERQAPSVPDVQIAKPEKSAKSSSWSQLCNDALAVASNLLRQGNLPLSKVQLRPRPAIDEFTPVKIRRVK